MQKNASPPEEYNGSLKKLPPGTSSNPLAGGTEITAKTMVFEAKSDPGRPRAPAEWKIDPGTAFLQEML